MLPYVKVYSDFIDIVRELDNGARGRLFMAIMQYANDEKPDNLTGAEKIAFLTMKSQIDRDRATYSEVSEKRRSAGKAGAAQRWGRDSMASAILPMANDGKNSKCKEDKDKDKEEDKDKDKDKEKDKRKKSHSNECDKERAGLFLPPALGDIVSYCRESGSSVNAERFYSYYAARGWKLPNGGDICDWRSLLRSWETKDGKTAASSAPVPGKTTARGNPDDLQRLERILGGIGNTCKEDKNG